MGHCGRCHYCDVTVIWTAIFSRNACVQDTYPCLGTTCSSFFLDYSEKYTTFAPQHYTDAIMSAMASQITSLTILYSTVYWGTVQWKHRSSASLAFVRGILRWPLNSPHKRPLTRNMFPFNYAILKSISRYLPGIRRQHMEYYFFLKSVWLSFQRVTIRVAKFWSASHCITTYHFYFLRRWKAICE